MGKQANYFIGYRVERKAKLMLEREGYFVIRAAGSHGKIDLAGFNKNEVRLIQLKVISYGEKRVFQKEQMELKNLPVCPFIRKEFWVYEKRLGWHYYPCS
jgi:Holliday junction resolvase